MGDFGSLTQASKSPWHRFSVELIFLRFPRIPVLHSDLEICNDPEPRRRTFSAQIVWPKMTEGGAYPFPEDAEDGLLLSLKLAGDGFCQEIRLAPVERFPADMVEHTITVESNEDVLAFCCDEDRRV